MAEDKPKQRDFMADSFWEGLVRVGPGQYTHPDVEKDTYYKLYIPKDIKQLADARYALEGINELLYSILPEGHTLRDKLEAGAKLIQERIDSIERENFNMPVVLKGKNGRR